MIDVNCSVLKKVKCFDIRVNGIQVVENEHRLIYYTDVFRSAPLFVYKREGQLIIFSEISWFLNNYTDCLEVDKIGLWETILFGNSIWTRTLYKNLFQLPAACKLSVNKKDQSFTIERYWDYCVEENSHIDSIEKAVEGFDLHLNRVFSELDTTQKYIMGMSGGLDSRITLAYLSKYIPSEKVDLFTYGHDSRILEYQYAKECAKALGFNIPNFHALNAESYRKALDYLPELSGGQIGINHCHMIDAFKKGSASDRLNISTYYTDALFGWECSLESEKSVQNPYRQKLDKIGFIEDSVREGIISDSEKLIYYYNKSSNLSSIKEYIYISERNQKFHIYLSYIQSNFVKGVVNPYLDFDLLHYALSLPNRYRQNKKIVDALLSYKFQNISSRDFKNISSRFQWGANFSGKVEFYKFKALNRVNAALRPLTRGRIQLFNEYQTEELERLLYRNFYTSLKESIDKFVSNGLINEEAARYYQKLPIRSSGIGERYTIISLAALLNRKEY